MPESELILVVLAHSCVLVLGFRFTLQSSDHLGNLRNTLYLGDILATKEARAGVLSCLVDWLYYLGTEEVRSLNNTFKVPLSEVLSCLVQSRDR